VKPRWHFKTRHVGSYRGNLFAKFEGTDCEPMTAKLPLGTRQFQGHGNARQNWRVYCVKLIDSCGCVARFEDLLLDLLAIRTCIGCSRYILCFAATAHGIKCGLRYFAIVLYIETLDCDGGVVDAGCKS